MATQNVVTPANLGSEFDLGVLVPNKITVKVDGTTILNTGGVLSAPAAVTADNGLTINPANNVQMGGPLVQNTNIAHGSFIFSESSVNVPCRIITTTGDYASAEDITTSGNFVRNVISRPLGISSHGFFAEAVPGANNSTGFYANMSNTGGVGLVCSANSGAVAARFIQSGGNGAMQMICGGLGTGGISITTNGAGARGVEISTAQNDSHGVNVNTFGAISHGIYTSVSGVGSYAGYFNGNVYYNGALVPSDRRLKENIVPVKSMLDRINALQVVEFDKYSEMEIDVPALKEEASEQESAMFEAQSKSIATAIGREFTKQEVKDGKARHRSFVGHKMGVIAQDLQEVFPEFVHEDATSGFLAIDEAGINYALLKAVQELSVRLAKLEG